MKELREAHHLSQQQVADGAHMPKRSYQRYEYNDRVPTLRQLISLAEFYSVSLDYLIGRTDDPTPPVLAKNWPESIGTPKKD